MLERMTGIKAKAVNGISLISFGISFIFICIGFDKLFRYENGDSYPYKLHNAYVGGDAYNYIINGNYATAYFVLATLFLILGFGVLILAYLKQTHGIFATESETGEIDTQDFQVEEI